MAATDHAPCLLDSYALIDADAHYTEPPDLWTSRAPASLKDRVPYVKRVDGKDRWFIEGDQDFGGVGLCIVDKNNVKRLELGTSSLPTFDECHPAAYDPKARLQVMDDVGLYAQILYPNTGGLSSSILVMKVRDNELRLACTKIFNDAMAEVQEAGNGRLFPMALLPVWDKKEMEREARRVVEDLGLRGFVVADKPEFLGMPDFLSDHWEPLWDVCSGTGTSINFHIGGDPSSSPLLQFPWQSYGAQTKVAIWTVLFSLSNARTIANFCYSGLFDKYPGLKIVSVESGLGWIPYCLEAMEYQLDEMMPDDGKKLQKRPTEYFRDHIYTTFWFEKHGPTLVEKIGVNNVMIETDFPHPTCLYPHKEHLEAIAKQWSPNTRKRILQDNAAELYRIQVPTP